MLRGIKGTYVYACDKNLREFLSNHIAAYRKEDKTDSASVIELVPFVNSVPIYNLEAAAGNLSELQIVNEDDFEWIELPPIYKPSKDLFACKVFGDSMNKVIPNGSICLFRKYNGGSRNGKIVLVEHTSLQEKDFGSGYTVKEYHSKKFVEGDQWSHQSIILKPLTSSPRYEDIEISNDEMSSLKVVGIFECVL